MKIDKEIDPLSLQLHKEVKYIDVDTFLSNKEAVILDIRTPAEYSIGHIDGAFNLPLFTDEQRVEVGTIYKKKGKELAVERGLEFVGEKLHLYVKEAKRYGKERPFYLYCWRGGMRSSSMAWLLSTAGLDVSVLQGGYKAYRSEFNELLEQKWNFITLLGSTGCGKTELLKEIEELGEQMLDLEGLANHKGSAFGGIGQQNQPTTEEFINRMHQKLRSFDASKRVWVEGESVMIGSCFIPKELYDLLVSSDFYLVDMPFEERVSRLTDEYCCFDTEPLEAALLKIAKRMGTDKNKVAYDALQSGDRQTAVKMALEYYDKGYAHASAKRVGDNLGTIVLENHNHKEMAFKLSNNEL